MLRYSSCVALTAALLLPAAAHAQLTIFNNRALFNAAAPGLPTETLEAGTPGNSSSSGPLDQFSNVTGFTPGEILPGVRLQAVGTTGVPGSGSDQFFYNNNAAYNTGNGTSVYTVNQSADTLDITFFNNTANAFGFDLGGSGTNNVNTIQVFGVGGALLGTQTVTPGASTFVFFGVTANQVVTRVNIAQSSFETVDNIAFGSVGGSNVAPEPATLALLTLGFGGALAARRRNAAR